MKKEIRPVHLVGILVAMVVISIASCAESEVTQPAIEEAEISTVIVETATPEPIEVPVVEPTTTIEEVNGDNSEQISTIDLNLGVMGYVILPGESTVRFELDEDLRSALTTWHQGSRITVVGATDQVFGRFALDFSNLTLSRFEDIQIDAHSFKTDDFWRTRAVQNEILESEAYPFINFSPTQIENLAESVPLGESITFNIMGDLTIRDITLPQTFVVSATLQPDLAILGNASTLVDRDNYGLVIPGVPHVSNVEEEVELYIDFVARKAGE